MAECRRIPLTPFTGDTFVKPAPVQKFPDEPRDAVETVRLELTLFESGERSFPEFSYSQLLDNKIKLSKGDVPLSGFEEEEKKADEEAAALARKYEEKYGGKAKKKDRIQDLIDIGYGYDEEDSFIDNSEAYDEFVPASITTKFGGFYVNSGVLHFRQASDTEDVPTGNTSDAFREKPKKKLCREDGDVKNSLDAENVLTEFVADEMRKKKKKKAAGPLTVASMLREGQTMGVSTQRSSPIVVVPTTPLCPADAGGGGGSGLTDPLLSLIGSTNDHALIQAVSAVDFDIDLESLLDVSEGSLGSLPAAEVPLFHPGAIDYPRPPNAGGALQLKPHPGQTQLLRPPSAHGCVPLPEGLPPGLEHSIGRLAAAAKTSEGESKLKFFTPDINSILRDIELRCREHGGQLRSRVYTHLSSFLPCSRDTLLRRVKKLLDTHTHTEEAPPDADDPLHKLKDAVGRAMPEQVALFQEKCQVYEQIRAAKATEEENGQEDNVEEKGGKRGGPKKLFKWNDEIRQCLFQVLRLKLQQCKTQKGSQELEEYLKTVLDNEVKPLWPKGWMQSRVLIRESRNVFNLLTSSPAKRSRLDRKPPSVVVRSDVCRAPPMKGLPEGAIAASTSLDAASLRPVEVKPAKPPTDEPVVVAATAPTPSLLDLLADQALAREQPLPFSQELLAAAVSNYQRSMQRWSVSSPPLPPPPPQSSPVGFPLSAASPGGFLQVAHLARRQMTPDEADVTLQ